MVHNGLMIYLRRVFGGLRSGVGGLGKADRPCKRHRLFSLVLAGGNAAVALLALCGIQCHGQASLSGSPFGVQQAGISQGAAVILNCSTNLTCTVSGGILSISSAGGSTVSFTNITSGNNTSAAMEVRTGATLGINYSGGTVPTLPANTSLFAVSSNARMASGSVANPGFFTSVRWDGTIGSLTAVQSGDQLGGYNSYAYNGTSLNGPTGSVRCFATENQGTTAAGTRCEIATTPNTTTTLTSVIGFEADGSILAPRTVTGGSRGSGTLNVTGLYQLGIQVATLAANLFTGQQQISLNGAASAPPWTMTGTWFSGGSSTTTKPQALIECNSGTTTSTAWSTNGTGLGVNACAGFTGNLIDTQLNGVSAFSVSSAGFVTVTPSANGSSFIINRSAGLNVNIGSASTRMASNSAANFFIGTNNISQFGFINATGVAVFGSSAIATSPGFIPTSQTNPILTLVDGTNAATADFAIPHQQSTTGQRYVCITTTGLLVSSAAACVGT